MVGGRSKAQRSLLLAKCKVSYSTLRSVFVKAMQKVNEFVNSFSCRSKFVIDLIVVFLGLLQHLRCVTYLVHPIFFFFGLIPFIVGVLVGIIYSVSMYSSTAKI